LAVKLVREFKGRRRNIIHRLAFDLRRLLSRAVAETDRGWPSTAATTRAANLSDRAVISEALNVVDAMLVSRVKRM